MYIYIKYRLSYEIIYIYIYYRERCLFLLYFVISFDMDINIVRLINY